MTNILIEGDRMISQRAEEVRDVLHPVTQDTIQKLFDVMDETGAMGFAAPQIGIPLRIFVFSSYPHVNHEDAPDIPRMVVINPVINSSEGIEEIWEKCYSLPGIRGLIPRYNRIATSYLTAQGKQIELALEGFPAHLFEHEYDHLDGKLYKQRVEDMKRGEIISEEEYQRRFGDDSKRLKE
jgi:peptide deformylase